MLLSLFTSVHLLGTFLCMLAAAGQESGFNCIQNTVRAVNIWTDAVLPPIRTGMSII